MTELKVVLPGDNVSLPSPVIGPGLCEVDGDSTSAAACMAGLLRGAGLEPGSTKKVWVDYNAKRVSRYKCKRRALC